MNVKEIQTLVMFGIIVLITLGITFWAARRNKNTTEFYAAGRKITGWQNGIAVAGDYMSAASFLGIASLIAFYGYDGFMYSVGWLVAYLTVLLLVAEPDRARPVDYRRCVPVSPALRLQASCLGRASPECPPGLGDRWHRAHRIRRSPGSSVRRSCTDRLPELG